MSLSPSEDHPCSDRRARNFTDLEKAESLSPSEDHPCSDYFSRRRSQKKPPGHCPPLRITPVPTYRRSANLLGLIACHCPPLRITPVPTLGEMSAEYAAYLSLSPSEDHPCSDPPTVTPNGQHRSVIVPL